MIHTGRLGRVARLARLAPAALGGDAEGLLTYEVLGSLKGGAQKLGQTLALVADGMPAPVRARLGALFGDAPPLPWAEAEAVLAAELGDLDRLFASLEREPMASASLGQVYRGVLHDGRKVAVKVQYPGVARALAADLANLDLASMPAVALLDAGPMLRDLRDAVLGELDYRAEAARGEAIRRAVAPWPDLVVPEAVPEASTGRVLCTTLLEGRTLHAAVDEVPAARRPGLALQLVAALMGPVFSAGLINADTHPGNLMLLDGERLGLVDFGAVAPIPLERVARLNRAMDVLLAGRGDAGTLRDLGVEPGPEAFIAAEFIRLLEPLGPGVWDFARDDLMERLAASKRKNALALRHTRIHPDVLPLVRATTGLHHNLRRVGVPFPLGAALAEVRRVGGEHRRQAT